MQSPTQKAIWCFLIVVIAVLLRAYTVGMNLPFFYDEDEAHHFNRTVNMAKSGDFNPRYFNKPSLHFYLRIPVVYGSVMWGKATGRIQGIDDIRTYNRFGLADYAFTASHPFVVKANRLLTLIFSIVLIIATYLVSLRAFNSTLVAVIASLLAAVSPELVSRASIIGVDIIMSALCWISILFALRYYSNGKAFDYLMCAIFAGLAVSTKYNALPIIALPVFAVLAKKPFSFTRLLISAFLPVAAFFAASPYILIELDQFIKNVRYEIWHYGVAGHEGHMAQPGVEQASFYLNWLYDRALGPIAMGVAAIGLFQFVLKLDRKSFLLALFPLLFFVEMSLQKTNFVRNMLVFVPFVGICAGLGAKQIISLFRPGSAPAKFIIPVLLTSLLVSPLSITLIERRSRLNMTDSRLELLDWFKTHRDSEIQTAISGYLLPPLEIPFDKNFTTVDDNTLSLPEIYLDGFNRLIVGNGIVSTDYSTIPYLKLVHSIKGVAGKQRIVINPAIHIYDFVPSAVLDEALRLPLENCEECALNFEVHQDLIYHCAYKPAGAPAGESPNTEDFCWQTKRVALLSLKDLASKTAALKGGEASLEFQIMSPWKGQRALLQIGDDFKSELLADAEPGSWQKVQVEVPVSLLTSSTAMKIVSDIVASPLKMGLNQDNRRLALAIRRIVVSRGARSDSSAAGE